MTSHDVISALKISHYTFHRIVYCEPQKLPATKDANGWYIDRCHFNKFAEINPEINEAPYLKKDVAAWLSSINGVDVK